MKEQKRHNCEICGDSHKEEAHGQPLSILQPSLHNTEEWADTVEGEAQSLCDKWQPKALTEEEADDPESADWRIEEAEAAISDAGYIICSENDSWLVYEPVKA